MLDTSRIEALINYHLTVTAKLAAIAATCSDNELDAPIVGGERSIRETLKHIVEVDWTWRTVLETRTTPVWEAMSTGSLHDITGIAAAHGAETAALLDWLHAQPDDALDAEIEVRFPWSQGPESYLPWRVLLQIPMHGQQHRSEIAVELSRLGKSPGHMDFIFLG